MEWNGIETGRQGFLTRIGGAWCGRQVLTICAAEDLRGADRNSLSDPYTTIEITSLHRALLHKVSERASERASE